MEKEEWEKLGFTPESTFENEQDEKKQLYSQIQQLKKRAAENFAKKKEQISQMKKEEENPASPPIN